MIKPAMHTCKMAAFSLSACTNLLAPLIIAIRAEYGIDTQMSGLLISSFFAGNLLMCFFSSKVTSVLGKTLGLRVAMTLMPLMCFGIALFSSFYLVCICLFLLGCCTLTTQVITNAIPTELSKDGAASSVSGLMAYNGVGAAAGLLFAGECDSLGLDWRFVYAIYGLVALIAAAICWKTKFPQMEKKNSGSARDMIAPLKTKQFVFILVSLLVYAGAETSICSWLVTYAVEECAFTTFAGSMLTAIIWMTIFFGRVACSHISKKVSASKIILVLIPVTIVSAFMITMSGKILVWMVTAVLGIALSGIWPLLSSELIRIGKKHDESTLLSLCFLFSFVGNTIVPYIIGFIAQRTNMSIAITADSFIFVVLMVMVIFTFLSISKRERYRSLR